MNETRLAEIRRRLRQGVYPAELVPEVEELLALVRDLERDNELRAVDQRRLAEELDVAQTDLARAEQSKAALAQMWTDARAENERLREHLRYVVDSLPEGAPLRFHTETVLAGVCVPREAGGQDNQTA